MGHFVAITASSRRLTLRELTVPASVTCEGFEPITLPESAGSGIDLVAADVSGEVWAAVTGAVSNRAYLLKWPARTWEVLGDGPVRGRYPVAIRPDGDVTWVQDAEPYVLRHLDGRRTDTRDTANPATPDPLSRAQLAPVTVCNVIRDEMWTFGEDVSAPGGVTRLYAQRDGQPVQHVWTGFTPLPARMVAHPDGSCTVAISIPDGIDEPLFIPSSAFTDYVAPVLSIPVQASPRSVWRGLAGGGPGNACWGVDGSGDRPVLGSPEELEQVQTPGWVWLSPKDSPDAERDFVDAIDAARRYQVPVVVYWDDLTYGRGWDWLMRAESAGVPVLRGVQCYPSFRGDETLDATVRRLEAVLSSPLGFRDVVIRPVYDQGHWPKAHVFGLQAALDRMIAGLPHIVADFGFGRSRVSAAHGMAAYDVWPELQTYWTELCRRTPTPAREPWPEDSGDGGDTSAPGNDAETGDASSPPSPEPAPQPQPAPEPELEPPAVVYPTWDEWMARAGGNPAKAQLLQAEFFAIHGHPPITEDRGNPRTGENQ